MANLSEEDQRVLLGPNYKEITARMEVESAMKRERWKRLMPFALGLLVAVSLFVVAAEAFF